MMNLIITTAEKDELIRAAYLEGSRANPNVPRDIFQDYDIAYIVDDTAPFIEDKSWIDRFGKRLYIQYPEDNESDEYKAACYGWLIQLSDGNRLDLHVRTAENALKNLEMYKTLVDKDGIMPAKENLSDSLYWVKKPTQNEFSSVCNEFWWCLNNIAKGLWRGEILYVMDVLNSTVRPQLRCMLEWFVGCENDFSLSVGKSAKYIGEHLPSNIYETYLLTFPNAEIEDMWESVIIMCELFTEAAVNVAKRLNLNYNFSEGKNSFDYLKHIKALPHDAERIF